MKLEKIVKAVIIFTLFDFVYSGVVNFYRTRDDQEKYLDKIREKGL